MWLSFTGPALVLAQARPKAWPKKILLGSKSKRCFERIIEYCDGWTPMASTGAEHDLANCL
jgi:hypothetical protein